MLKKIYIFLLLFPLSVFSQSVGIGIGIGMTKRINTQHQSSKPLIYTNIYVADSTHGGRDGVSGTGSITHPFASAHRAASWITTNHRDTIKVNFAQSSTFTNDSFVIVNTNYIKDTIYGSGASPVFTNLQSLADGGWSTTSGNIRQYTDSKFSDKVQFVIQPGYNYVLGTVYYGTVSTFTKSSLYVPADTHADHYWDGAQLVIELYTFDYITVYCTSYIGHTFYFNTIHYDATFPPTAYSLTIQNHVNCLTVNGTFAYNQATKTLYVDLNTGLPTGVSASYGSVGMKLLTCNNVSITGLTFKYHNTYDIWQRNCNNNSIQNITSLYAGYATYEGDTVDGTFINNVFSNHSLGCGIFIFNYPFYKNTATIQNCTVDTCGIIYNRLYTDGNCGSSGGVGCGNGVIGSAICILGINNFIDQYNTTNYCGYSGHNLENAYGVCRYNLISNSMIAKTDGGLIYLVNTSGAISINDNILSGILINSATGIRSDGYCYNPTISNNLLLGNNCTSGYIGTTYNHLTKIINNTLFNTASNPALVIESDKTTLEVDTGNLIIQTGGANAVTYQIIGAGAGSINPIMKNYYYLSFDSTAHVFNNNGVDSSYHRWITSTGFNDQLLKPSTYQGSGKVTTLYFNIVDTNPRSTTKIITSAYMLSHYGDSAYLDIKTGNVITYPYTIPGWNTNGNNWITWTKYFGTITLTAGSTVNRCQGAGTYTTAYTQNNSPTSITGSLDAASVAGGNTITGTTTTFQSTWSGNTQVRLSGYKTTPIVQTIATPSSPVFNSGAISCRAQCFQKLSYAASTASPVHLAWQTGTNVSFSNNNATITSTGSGSWCKSLNKINTGTYVAYIAGDKTATNNIFGLVANAYLGGSILWGYEISGTLMFIREGVTNITSFGYNIGDTLKVILTSSNVQYYQNSSLIYTSLALPTQSNYYIGVLFGTNSSSINHLISNSIYQYSLDATSLAANDSIDNSGMVTFNHTWKGISTITASDTTISGCISSSAFSVTTTFQADAQAQAYINAIRHLGASVDTAHATALHIFNTSKKINSVYNIDTAEYNPIWQSSTTCAINMLNPTKHTLTYTGTKPSFLSNGMQGNGTSSYAITDIIPNIGLSSNNMSLSFYGQNNTTGAYVEIGATSNTTTALLYLCLNYSGTQYWIDASTSNLYSVGSQVSSIAYMLVSKIANSANSFFAYKNNYSKFTGTGGGNNPTTYPIYIGAMNYAGTVLYSNRIGSFMSIGAGYTNAQCPIYMRIVNDLMTDEGLNTY